MNLSREHEYMKFRYLDGALPMLSIAFSEKGVLKLEEMDFD